MAENMIREAAKEQGCADCPLQNACAKALLGSEAAIDNGDRRLQKLEEKLRNNSSNSFLKYLRLISNFVLAENTIPDARLNLKYLRYYEPWLRRLAGIALEGCDRKPSENPSTSTHCESNDPRISAVWRKGEGIDIF